MVYVVCVCVCVSGLNVFVYSVNWVGVFYNVGIRVLWSGGWEEGIHCMVSHIGMWCEWLETK